MGVGLEIFNVGSLPQILISQQQLKTCERLHKLCNIFAEEIQIEYSRKNNSAFYCNSSNFFKFNTMQVYLPRSGYFLELSFFF